MSKHVSVIIVPHDNSKTYNLRFSYRLLITFSVLVLVLLGSLAVFIIKHGSVVVAAERAALLSRENERLKSQVAQIDSLKLELLNLHAMSIQIKGMLGIQLSEDDSLLVANLSADANSPAIAPEEMGDAVGPAEQKKILDALPSMWPVKGYVTREFRITGGEKNPDYHPGMDIAADRNTPVRAAAEGIVETSRYDETYGWVVEIDHGYGIHTLYGHNARNLVSVGDRVTRGKTIAFVGSTGKSTAPHLHFEVRKNGVSVDPREYLLN